VVDYLSAEIHTSQTFAGKSGQISALFSRMRDDTWLTICEHFTNI